MLLMQTVHSVVIQGRVLSTMTKPEGGEVLSLFEQADWQPGRG